MGYRKITATSYRRLSMVGIILMFIGIGLGIWGAKVLLKEHALTKKGIRTQGTVVSVHKNGIYRSPIVEFNTLEGERISFRSNFEYNLDLYPYKIGDVVPVIYEPNNPNSAEIDAFWEHNFLYLFLIGLGMILLLVGFVVRFVFLKKARAYES